MKIHILGIGGTFMGGIALLARELGHEISGSDSGVYPPMSLQLREQGIRFAEGYAVANLQPTPDLVIIGNALSRGNECVEFVLDKGLPYNSGPQWLAENVLRGRAVYAVSGTHGKTTTTSMLAWILNSGGSDAGFLIGGIAENFGVSAHGGGAPPFVVEADEYDTAFFDKRSKFIHYRPTVLLINGIEYDHADIFADIEAIRREFRHMIRTIPGTGTLIHKFGDKETEAVLAAGCWTPKTTFGLEQGEWTLRSPTHDHSSFEVLRHGQPQGTVQWDLYGRHNAENALAAVAAAVVAGTSATDACRALGRFKAPKRRMQRVGEQAGVTVYDDFAHHPTAIAAALDALRRRVGAQRIVAILEPRSNSMKRGAYRDSLAGSLRAADRIYVLRPAGLGWDLAASLSALGNKCSVFDRIEDIIEAGATECGPGDHLLIMSNGPFGGIHGLLLERLRRS